MTKIQKYQAEGVGSTIDSVMNKKLTFQDTNL